MYLMSTLPSHCIERVNGGVATNGLFTVDLAVCAGGSDDSASTSESGESESLLPDSVVLSEPGGETELVHFVGEKVHVKSHKKPPPSALVVSSPTLIYSLSILTLRLSCLTLHLSCLVVCVSSDRRRPHCCTAAETLTRRTDCHQQRLKE